jgi:hypothetical protein
MSEKNRFELLVWKIRDHKVGAVVVGCGIAVISLGSFVGAIDRIWSFSGSLFVTDELPLLSAPSLQPLNPTPPNAWHFDRSGPSDALPTATVEAAHLVYDEDGFPTLKFLIRNPLEKPTTVQGLSILATFRRTVGGGGPDTIFTTRELITTTYVIDLSDFYKVAKKSPSGTEQYSAKIQWNLPNPIVIAAGDFVHIGVKFISTKDGYIRYPSERLVLAFGFVTDRGIFDDMPVLDNVAHLDEDKMYSAAKYSPGKRLE